MRALRRYLQDLTSAFDGFAAAPFGLPLTCAYGARYSQEMATRDLIMEKLTNAFRPAHIDVVDESHQHVGHSGHRPGGQTHFRVYIVAEAFKGKSRLERHRMVNDTLASELRGGVHALAIHAGAPDEPGG
jgi:BolA family transcriptional regulator, general stress-responsive regulator